MQMTGAPAARAAWSRATEQAQEGWRSTSVMAVSPIDLRGMFSTPKRYITKP